MSAQRELLPYLVKITSEGPFGQEIGSGLIIGQSENTFYLVTAAHVIATNGEAHEKIEVYFNQRRLDAMTAEFKGVDETKDLGLISVSNITFLQLPRLAYSRKINLKQGEKVVNIGHPNGQDWFINIQEQVNISVNPNNNYEFGITSGAIAPGSSGSPVFSRDNRWIGLITETSSITATCVITPQVLAFVETLGYPTNLVSPNVAPPMVDNTTLIFGDDQSNSIAPQNFRDEFVGEMVWVEGGTYKEEIITFNPCNNEKGPCYYSHNVTVDGFYMGRYEVTQKIWTDIMGYNPSFFKGCDQCPVENIDFDEIFHFLRKLNKKTGLKYRLPTEAEWEYAARGGEYARKTSFAGSNDLDRVAWHKNNSSKKTHPVGEKFYNELEIYDLSGNVWELCSDWMGENQSLFASRDVSNPKGPNLGKSKVARGGSWNSKNCRVQFEDGSLRWFLGAKEGVKDEKSNNLGIRLVLSPEG